MSDLKADPSVRFGTLPNGMRYAIMHNATPPHQSSLMLRIDAGSLMEKEDQLGLAHFMEHMAFNGTKGIPKNDMIAILQRLGLAFGADLNAATSFDQTFYQLQMPESDDKTLDTGLFVLRQQVSAATMDPDDIVGERGVIAGEERLRNSPGQRVARQEFGVLAAGQKVVDRFPIGDLKIINTATRDRFVDFYNSYYRPSRATIVAVGDFDVDAMEAKIRTQFSDWQPVGKEGAEPDLGKVAAHKPGEAHVFVEPGIGTTVVLTWVKAPKNPLDTVAGRREDLIEQLGFAVLNRRLSELSRTDDAPFLQAASQDSTMLRSVRLQAIQASVAAGKWQRGLAAIDQERRRFSRFGITDAELTREINDLRTGYQNAAKTAATRRTPALSAGLISAVNDRQVFTSPQTDLELFEHTVKGVTAAQVNAALRTVFVGDPVTILTSPTPVEGGEKALAVAYKKSQAVAVVAPVPTIAKPWPYTDFGKPGVVVARREIPTLGVTIVTFANGVTLTVKPTDFAKNSVIVNLLTGLGEQNFPSDIFDPRAALIGQIGSGGLGKLTVDEVNRALNGHIVNSGFSMMGDRFLFQGATRREDLQLEMQYMAAYLTDPAFRATPLEQAKAAYPTIYQSMLAMPAGAFNANARILLAGGDQRAGVLSPEAFSKLSLDPWRAQLRQLLSVGPIHLTMVGDVSIDDAIKQTASTFGALPPRPAAGSPVPSADIRRFPAGTAKPLEFRHYGLAEQSYGYIAWPTVDAVRDLAEARRIELLSAVLNLRVLEEIREKEALAYSPHVRTNYSDTYKGYGALAIEAETAPDKLPAFYDAVDKVTARLRDEPISEDELKRARMPLIETSRRSLSSNMWWASELSFLVDRPWYEPQVLTGIAEIERMTPADIQALAQKYLRPETAWRAEAVPASLATGNPPGSRQAASK